MSSVERLREERLFHDQQALARASTFQTSHKTLRFADSEYLDHESWIRPAMAELGSVRGVPVLDYGCGHGMAAVVLARAGATVSAIDLSVGYVTEASQRARANDVDIRFVVGDAGRLPFANCSFAAIWGHAILHHLDVAQAAGELCRVLQPGGTLVLCEPWGENPVLSWARNCLPYPGKHRTRDEAPLRDGDVALARKHFPNLRLNGHQLLTMARRILPMGRMTVALDLCDNWLLSRAPGLGRYCRYMVLTAKKA